VHRNRWALRGMEAAKQQDIDRTMVELDGAPKTGRTDASVPRGVSLAVAQQQVPLRIPLDRYP
jgi:enolase